MFVSHNLNDVFEVADRIAVLRLGQMVGDYGAGEVTTRDVVELMTTGATTGGK
jgi:ABC-type sugar transport system ATPase subunit